MENNNQRIIFAAPEGISPADIILNIFKKNGLKDYDSDDNSDADDDEMLKILTVVSDLTKNFFDKKISEQAAIKLLTDQLKINSDKATGIMSGIKEDLLPLTKKITVREAGEVKPITAMPVSLIDETKNQNIAKNLNITEETVAQPKENKKFTKKDQQQPQNFQTKPDNYREPIE